VRKITPRGLGEWGSVVPVWVGLSGVVASFVVWVVTGNVSPVLLGSFGTMIAAGQGAEVIVALKAGPGAKRTRKPKPKPSAEEHAS
jgi:hypothetical protein